MVSRRASQIKGIMATFLKWWFTNDSAAQTSMQSSNPQVLRLEMAIPAKGLEFGSPAPRPKAESVVYDHSTKEAETNQLPCLVESHVSQSVSSRSKWETVTQKWKWRRQTLDRHSGLYMHATHSYILMCMYAPPQNRYTRMYHKPIWSRTHPCQRCISSLSKVMFHAQNLWVICFQTSQNINQFNDDVIHLCMHSVDVHIWLRIPW